MVMKHRLLGTSYNHLWLSMVLKKKVLCYIPAICPWFLQAFPGPKRPKRSIDPWFQDAAYAGVSSFGFGGTNAHAEAKMGPSFELAVFTVALLKSG